MERQNKVRQKKQEDTETRTCTAKVDVFRSCGMNWPLPTSTPASLMIMSKRGQRIDLCIHQFHLIHNRYVIFLISISNIHVGEKIVHLLRFITD